MVDLFLLSERQMTRISPFFPLAPGVPRVDDRRVVSGYRLCDPQRLAVEGCAEGIRPPHKTLYNRFIRWSRLGVFDRTFANLAGDGLKAERVMIDAAI